MAIGAWPAAFAARQMAVTDGTQYVRLGGSGPAVLLLHGFGDTGDMWVPLAEFKELSGEPDFEYALIDGTIIKGADDSGSRRWNDHAFGCPLWGYANTFDESTHRPKTDPKISNIFG
jgi:hypothetical protein